MAGQWVMLLATRSASTGREENFQINQSVFHAIWHTISMMESRTDICDEIGYPDADDGWNPILLWKLDCARTDHLNSSKSGVCSIRINGLERSWVFGQGSLSKIWGSEFCYMTSPVDFWRSTQHISIGLFSWKFKFAEKTDRQGDSVS